MAPIRESVCPKSTGISMVAKINRDKELYGINHEGSSGSLGDEDLGHRVRNEGN